MNRTAGKSVAILGLVPLDVRIALAREFDLVDEQALNNLGAAAP